MHPIPLSALQHWLFCPRQCALIHIEQAWAENHFTAEGRVMHQNAHEGADETRNGIRITRGMHVGSEIMGIAGVCDVVEFHRDGKIFPVEYKRGKPKSHRADEVQLCAQAMCLEEMLATHIEQGFLYYGEKRRRTEVMFDSELRDLTVAVIAQCSDMLRSGKTPAAVLEKHCGACSLIDICLPEATRSNRRSAEAWFLQHLQSEPST